jgi:hypothetical protein
MVHHIFKVSVTIMANGMINRQSKPGELIKENPTEGLQRCAVLGYERMRESLAARHSNKLCLDREIRSFDSLTAGCIPEAYFGGGLLKRKESLDLARRERERES